MTPSGFMAEYERRTNTHRFGEVAELIADDAVFWFSEGSYTGKVAIRQAFERTWALIQDENYEIIDVVWLADSQTVAVCIYTFHWQGVVDGRLDSGTGRGTSVLRNGNRGWQVVHEHLSRKV